MRNTTKLLGAFLAASLAVLAAPALAQAPAAPAHNMANMPPPASGAKVLVSDPTSVVMIVNRDSNDIAFMDIKTKELLGRTFLGNNVNPHMVMMSPDGRYVVTGGQRSNIAYIIDSRTLELVAKILEAHSEVRRMRVEGHTDNRGNYDALKKLSAARADAIVKWLIAHGIAEGRLVAQGYGPDRPIDTNETEAGRANNSRIELNVLVKP
jgi:hypothetical protein